MPFSLRCDKVQKTHLAGNKKDKVKDLKISWIYIKKGSFIENEDGQIYMVGEDTQLTPIEDSIKVHNMEMSHLYRPPTESKQDIDF